MQLGDIVAHLALFVIITAREIKGARVDAILIKLSICPVLFILLKS